VKVTRQKKILDLIINSEVKTQEDLQVKLKDSGYNVTQATISRDIRELGLIKIASSNGEYKYNPNAAKEKESISGKFSSILIQAAHSVDYAKNLVVIKTYIGMGSAAGAAVDSMELPGVIGSVSGDDTLLIITRDDDTAAKICDSISKLIGQSK